MIFLDLEVVADASFKGIIISSKSSSINLLFMSGQRECYSEIYQSFSTFWAVLSQIESKLVAKLELAGTMAVDGSQSVVKIQIAQASSRPGNITAIYTNVCWCRKGETEFGTHFGGWCAKSDKIRAHASATSNQDEERCKFWLEWWRWWGIAADAIKAPITYRKC